MGALDRSMWTQTLFYEIETTDKFGIDSPGQTTNEVSTVNKSKPQRRFILGLIPLRTFFRTNIIWPIL